MCINGARVIVNLHETGFRNIEVVKQRLQKFGKEKVSMAAKTS
ncbi:hypothetical protein OSCI_2110002 [Kamptonema sp. PCC 6506]|nr:hypothetical protein OSCI_2110002 [Kamptonema sp. PCC 6506]